MPKILYIHFAKADGNSEDGCDIYDRKTIDALLHNGCDVDVVEIVRKHSIGLPFWAMTSADHLRDRVAAARAQGRKILCSHESLFGLLGDEPADMLIVHNYYPAFSFPGRKAIQYYYRAGARSYFSKSFSNARCIVFLSARDHSHALAHFPCVADVAQVFPPPPYPAKILERRMDLIHISGSENWLPKRLCRLTKVEADAIRARGYAIGDFGAAINPAFALITDRFAVGFKLKLMQMIYSRDVIAALCDIAEDVQSVVPDYPFFRSAGSVIEALEYFQDTAKSYSVGEINAACDAALVNLRVSWEQMAVNLIALLAQRSSE